MTERLKGCTVAFTHDIREDDAEAILSAIRQLRGVAEVTGSEVTQQDWMIRTRIRAELKDKLWEVVK